MSETESEDDNLDCNKRHNERKGASPPEVNVDDNSQEDATDALGGPSDESGRLPQRQRAARQPGEKIAWSEDDDEGAYEKFKKRKSLKRKRVSAVTRSEKVRARIATARTDDNRGSSKRRKEPVRQVQKSKHYGDDSDHGLMEDSLPSFLKRRRKAFDAEYDDIKEAALKIPPSFDDIVFSDDDRPAHVKERPQFPHGKAGMPYKDVDLPYSLGVIPAPIAQWLRDYQFHGTGFLHELFVYQKGGILGDDMGLGKTVQVIAFLTAAFGKTGDARDAKRMRKMRRHPSRPWYPRVLVICPGSLIENWKAEFNRWGWWQIDVYHGDSKEAALSAASAGRLEIMITTYATYRLNQDAINMVEWDCVVADEVHQIKERSSEIARAMNDVNALCRIGLTGTAIQNKYEELWTLLNWTNPGRFGPISTWRSSISHPLRMGQSHDATIQQLSRARKTAKKLVENLLPAFFLRRMKSLIAAQLPKKSDKVVFCPLTTTQRNAYECFLSSPIVTYIRQSSEPCDCSSGKKKGWCCYTVLPDSDTRWQHLVFPAIVTLQKLANHLAIIIPQSGDPADRQAKDLDTLQIILPDLWTNLYATRDSILNYSNPEFCGKWRVLRKLLRFWHAEGDKVLVFSHSVRLLRMLQSLFNHTAYNVAFLDGSLSYEDRQAVVDGFNADAAQFVFLISTKAGGVGLNITSANKVVVFDPNWNPSYDLQAQDRAYRIGQVRDVEVFRLVSVGTIEEVVYARQVYKQQQAEIGYRASEERRYFRGVMGQKEKRGEIFGLGNMFEWREGSGGGLRDIVNKTNVAEAKAGVDVVGVVLATDDAEHEDDPLKEGGEDDAISQLAALVTAEDRAAVMMKSARKRKTDAVQAILAGAGVDYTHENSEVIGSSKVEAQLSRHAEAADTGVVGEAETHVFAPSQESSTDQDHRSKYHPPLDVMQRQFCTMAKTLGRGNTVEFALMVEGMTQGQRRDCLERFYSTRRERLSNQ